jgi:hypothetical protein
MNRWGKPRDLQFVHNVRPPMALADPLNRSSTPVLIMLGIILGLAALVTLTVIQGME